MEELKFRGQGFVIQNFFWRVSHFPLKVIQKERRISFISREKDWFFIY